MHVAMTLVVLLSVVVTVGALSHRYGLPAPLVLTVIGAVGSFLPGVPHVPLTPDLVLIGLLPPLLYAAAIRTSLHDFRHNLRPIGLLSVGLVIVTTVGVGLAAYAVIPGLPLAAALALGAVVAPPDAVAATAVARRVGMPRRIVTILEGESLVNDATALVALRTAVGAIGAAGVAVGDVAVDFAVSAGGGLVVGVLVAVVVGKVRRYLRDPLTDTSLSLLTPYAAYLAAEEIHASGVLALVVTGLLLGHLAPRLQSASSRTVERTNWKTIAYVLENSVFLLIGLQTASIVDGLAGSDLSPAQIVTGALVVFLTVVVLRPLWVFPATYLPRRIPAVARRDPAPPWTVPAVISWAGMRGVVTLAAVFVLPPQTPHREVLVLIALLVVGGTLLLQGATLPWIVRRLGLAGPDPAEDALAEAETYQRAAGAGLRRLEEIAASDVPADVMVRLRRRSVDRANAAWERLRADETPSQVYARLRLEMLRAERDEVLRVREEGGVPHEVLQRVLYALDIEETTVEQVSAEVRQERAEELRGRREGCEHLVAATTIPAARTPEGCEECLRDGTGWVHLRLCLSCGHVGCCDSSAHKHASAHFRESGHPVMRSFEPGEAWRWCFVDEVVG